MSSKKGAISWALYDWANSAFATTVIAGFFPIFFKDYWSRNSPAETSTFWLGLSISAAGLMVAVFSPVLGSLADMSGRRKEFLAFFAMVGALLTGALHFIPAGDWPAAAAVYTLSTVCFLSANVFYDALLLNVSTPGNVDRISSFGYALGYAGGGLLFLVNVLMVQQPAWFGLAGPAEAVQWSFLMVAVWWIAFTLPLILRVPEPFDLSVASRKIVLRAGFHEYLVTLKSMIRNRNMALFLLAYWLYIDGVDTVISMAVDFGKSIGIGNSDLITSLLIVQFVGFPFALLFGWLGQKAGPRPMIMVCIVVYIGVSVGASVMTASPIMIGSFGISQFMILAFAVALVQGGIQALSRSFFSRMVPPYHSAEYYGFFNMIGKFAAIIGPVLMGFIGVVTGNPRFGILSVAILFIAGALLLMRVKTTE